ncbi:MAG TPA: hypothetical protein VIA06_14970, partial [Candidatus Dormibacteraeota bacterium]|nr:hypothetical protein [Candidatus Dormibacteraeota bacterium]
MNESLGTPGPAVRRGWRDWRGWPIVLLLVIPTTVAEVLFGSTTLSDLPGVVLEAGMYGCGAILIREVVRRRGGSWPSLLLLGAAYATVEEGLVEPTWFTPQLFHTHWGVLAGVFWPYAAFNIAYHAVWSITVPILITEQLFPSRRDQSWIGNRGLGIVAAIYLIDCGVTWAFWNLVIIPLLIHAHPHVSPVLFGASGVLLVVLLALGWWSTRAWPGLRSTARGAAPHAAVVGVAALIAGGLWFGWAIAPTSLLQAFPFELLLVFDALVVAVSAWLVATWSRRPGWGDLHIVAVCTGSLIAQMGGGFVLNQSSL